MRKLRACVLGASGGIGAALVAELAASWRYGAIYAGSRSPIAASAPVVPFAFDLTDEASIGTAASAIAATGSLDLILIATGLLQDATAGVTPEKSYRAIDPVMMARVFAINTIGPALIAKHFLPLLPRTERCVFAAISARVGSIGDNRLGGWHSYRASKAALNMLIANAAIEARRRNPQAIAVTLHPGTVDTALSAPFQTGVAADRLFPPQRSADHLLQVIGALTPADSGGLFAWDGARIPF